MILLSGHSLTQSKRIPVEALSLSLKERTSTASLTPADMSGITTESWFLDDTEPGSGIVWRVNSIRKDYDTDTTEIQLEHVINTLKDKILFGEITPEMMGGSGGSCTAQQAVTYILNQQSDWVLGTFSYGSVSNPYKFDGDSLFDALKTVSDSLNNAWWSYDMSVYPFRLNITTKPSGVACELRSGRNLASLTKTIDKSTMYTRFYPIGKDDLHISGNYVSRNENLYGVISKVEVKQSLETEGELIAWANERLDKHAQPSVTVTADGMELAEATGVTLDKLTLGRICRIPLPEFSTTIEERIVELEYRDKIHAPEVVQITMGNQQEDIMEILANEITEGAGPSGRGGRGGARQAGEDHAWFEDTDTYVAMVAEGIIGVDPETGEPNWVRLSEFIADGEGLHAKVETQFEDVTDRVATLEINEEEIRSEVSASESTLYTTISQTAGGIRADMVASESGLYSYIDATASYLRTHFVSGSNKVFIQDNDPRNDPSYTPKAGDIWIESTSHGTWEGAEGFDWDHDVDYDWSQVQGAKMWGWQNGQWELVSDQQQVVNMADVEETAERYVNQKVRLVVNDDGNISVYLSRLEQEADRIRAEVEDYAQSLGSSILQTASQIRSEVHAAESYLYSAVEQSASGIIARVNESSNIYTGHTAPTGTPTKPIKDGDMWIDSILQRNWSDVDDLISWVDDEDYDWRETQGSKVRVYDGDTGTWVEVLDETVLMNHTDYEMLADGYHQVSRSIETLGDGLNAYIGNLEVTSKNMRLDYTDRYRQLNSSITSTASQLRSEFNATASGLSSSITQTASQIRSEVRNTNSQLATSITQTASAIRLEAHAAQSQIYSSITQTASSIRSEVASTTSSIRSSITQTASQIRSEVASTTSSIRSSITQNANKIALVVDGNGIKPASIVAAINDSGSSVVISADHVNLNGYVSASNFSTVLGNLYSAHIQRLYVDANIYGPNGLSMYTNGLWNVTLSGPVNNVYTLKQMTLDGTETTIGTFSRATSLSGEWSSGTITVTASPQGTTFIETLSTGETTWSGNTATVPINALWGSSGQYSEPTGWNVTVNATARYNAGYSEGKTDYKPDNIRISGKNVYALNAAGDDVGGPFSCTAIYNNGYNDANDSYSKWNNGSNASLYYYDTSSLSYKVATGSAKRWYYKS